MIKQKVAILVDSGTDIPKEYVEKYEIFVLPLKIIYKDREYLSGVDISAQQIYDRLAQEIPKTSLPGFHETVQAFDKIKALGFEQVIAVTISAGLSGTFNVIRLAAEDYEGLEIAVIDTKNISMGSGFFALKAGRLLEEGQSFAQVVKSLKSSISSSRIFFCLPTLEYLQKGGRIGLVSALLGNVLNLKPIISCNEEGIYYTAEKVRGWKKTLQRTTELAASAVVSCKRYNLCFLYGTLDEETKAIAKTLRQAFSRAELFIEQQVSPALGVHTGPGVIGVAVELLEN